MSYCRWSSDDCQCDVYVYADASGGWTTHVAARKRIFVEPLPPAVSLSDPAAWLERHRALREIMERSELVSIGLPEDGKSFSDATPAQCANRLKELRRIGYRVPQYAIDCLLEEEAGEQS